MKICRKCGIEKSVANFNKNSARSDGLQSQCRECTKANARSHYERNKTYYLSRNREYRKANMLAFIDYMQDKSCKDCGIADLRVLEFDHKRDKEFNISERLAYYPLESLLSEIEKCEIVCANCHKIRTATTFGWYDYE